MRIGEVMGNAWVESYASYCGWAPCMGGQDVFPAMNDGEIRSKIDQGKSDIRNWGGYNPNNYTHAVSHYSAVDLTNRLNHAGRAAEFDADAGRVAAFGEVEAD